MHGHRTPARLGSFANCVSIRRQRARDRAPNRITQLAAHSPAWHRKRRLGKIPRRRRVAVFSAFARS